MQTNLGVAFLPHSTVSIDTHTPHHTVLYKYTYMSVQHSCSLYCVDLDKLVWRPNLETSESLTNRRLWSLHQRCISKVHGSLMLLTQQQRQHDEPSQVLTINSFTAQTNTANHKHQESCVCRTYQTTRRANTHDCADEPSSVWIHRLFTQPPRS